MNDFVMGALQEVARSGPRLIQNNDPEELGNDFHICYQVKHFAFRKSLYSCILTAT